GQEGEAACENGSDGLGDSDQRGDGERDPELVTKFARFLLIEPAGSVVVSCAHLVDTPLARNLVGRRPMVRVEHKGRGVNHSINLEIKIEQVSADRRRDCSESDRWSGCALAVLGTLAFGP